VTVVVAAQRRGSIPVVPSTCAKLSAQQLRKDCQVPGADFSPLQMKSSDDEPARLQALVAEQAALRRVAMAVARGVSADDMFTLVCKELGSVLDVKSTDMIRYDDGFATVVGTWASGTPAFPVGVRIPVDGETVTAKLRRTRRPQQVDDYAGVEGELATRLRAFGMRSVVGAPITVAGSLWGAIMATSERPHAFPAGTEQRIADFAELVTAALANVEAREQLAASRARIVAAADDARRRIERDLHDGAQQRLVALALHLRLLQSDLAPDSEAAGKLAAARSELDHALGELRELARGIHPSVLTDRGLEAALVGLANRAPVPVELEMTGADALPLPVQTTAYFVVAEALTNAFKHAGCSSVEVGVHLEDGCATVEVRDDGVGGTDPAAGSGLLGLADRVSALGGTLDIESAPRQGTTVRASIAVETAERVAGAPA
jgi:signal transduction histidine kinase